MYMNTSTFYNKNDPFSQLSNEWWDEDGKFQSLHKFTDIRMTYINRVVSKYTEPEKSNIFHKIKCLDIGCGGGLLSERLARLGASVTGIDITKNSIEIAKVHALKSGLNINYLDIDNRNLDYIKIEGKSNKSSDKASKIKDVNLTSMKKNMLVDTTRKNSINEIIVNNKNDEINLLETKNTNETSAVANERIQNEEMVLKSSGNSWVEIEDYDGNSYLTRLMRAGETFVVPNKKGLTLSTGNAGVLSLTFGSTHVSRLGGIGEVISSRPLNIEAFKKR